MASSDINELTIPDDECTVTLFHGFKRARTYQLKLYPDEISDRQGADWIPQTIVGRTSPLVSFVSTGERSVSFTFSLYAYSEERRKEIDQILAGIYSCLYPEVSGDYLAPLAWFVFGGYQARGRITNISTGWKKPIINKRYVLCDVSIEMISTSDTLLKASDVRTAPHMKYFFGLG